MDKITEFLIESNKIEGIYDNESLEQAKKAWELLSGEFELSIKTIQDAHRILMQDKLWPSQIGIFRNCDIKEAQTPYKEVPPKMHDWVINVNISMKYPRTTHDNAKISRKWHIQFERIHPFVSGNGIMGRILMNWFRLMVGLPVLVIYESRKNEYYEWFKVMKVA